MLPQFQTDDKDFGLMQNTWATQLNPLLNSPISNPVFLKSVSLNAGINTINHKLDHTLQGWIVVRQRSSASLYDKQDTNTIPDKTLILASTSAVTVDLLVF